MNKSISPQIKTNNLSIIFSKNKQNQFTLLSKLNLNFFSNKIYFIVGNSGVGKTTLINHFNGLLKSSDGDIFVEDIAILGKNRKIKNVKKLRKVISIVFQFPEYQLFKSTVEEDIMFGPLNFGFKKNEAKKLAKFYLNMVGLDDNFLQACPFNLSGGQKRRVAIAGILAIEPKIIVFDEPTAGLDPKGEMKIIEIIEKLKADGKTIIVISHTMDLALKVADEILMIDKKTVTFSGKPYALFTNNQILTTTNIVKPKIIQIIDCLVQHDKSFASLYSLQPKTIEQLAKGINDVLIRKE